MASRDTQLAGLRALLRDHPQITLAEPSAPEYGSLRATFFLDNDAVPLAIVRPQSIGDISVLVRYAISNQIRFVVRTGGHNLFGHSQVEGALTIDMRDINYVRVQDGSVSAKVGGGILQGNLAARLSEKGLCTPIGTVSSVGYVGWAAYGGYGPLSGNFGLGLDQIISAKIVNSQGEIIDADEKLMAGIRGAGGAFGIIGEVTIKVYPLKNVLAGIIIYDSHDIKSTFEAFNVGYRRFSPDEIPPQLTVQQLIVNSPHGRVMVLSFMWSSEDTATGSIWLKKFETLGNVVMNTVAVQSLPEWMAQSTASVPPRVYGTGRTHNIREMNSDISAILGTALENMPTDPGTMLSLHQLRGPSAKDTPGSLFASRFPHYMLEVLGFASLKENKEDSVNWATGVWETVSRMDSNIVLPQAYISLDHMGQDPNHAALSRVYGANDGALLALKREYDPKNVFDLAIPRIKSDV